MLLTTSRTSERTVSDYDVIPAEAAMVISALEAGNPRGGEKRTMRRHRYRVPATLRLFSDHPSESPWVLYTREANPRSLGFITPHRLPLGYGGLMELPGPTGEPLRIHCTLLRCRQAAPGWFEGAVYFNREQPQFELG